VRKMSEKQTLSWIKPLLIRIKSYQTGM
jgi:hypothetical protein